MKKILLVLTAFAFSSLTLIAQNDPTTDDWFTTGLGTSTPSKVAIGITALTTSSVDLNVGGHMSIDNNGQSYFRFNNTWSGPFSPSLDKNGIRWQTPNAGTGLDSIRFYMLYNYGENKLFFDNNDDHTDSVAMTIEQGGNVGIGTTTPAAGYALSVDGGILCDKLQILPTGAWPDYVFKDDYDLWSLNKVEKYIKQNNHLPGVPSAKRVEEEGISVGEMNRIM
ncbi:MAG: hypothetical protein HKN75_06020, partial [Bacteroidia bacterium]|nr:hypothetical protein [Bacteroidia bacterium]